MHRSPLWRGAAVAVAIVVYAVTAGAAAGKTRWADLRVVTHTGKTLAEFRQYTGSTAVRSSRRADCFAGSSSSDRRYRLKGASALGILKDALASDRDLRPLTLSNAYVDSGLGLGVCSIGGFETVDFSYWDLIRDDVASSTGAEFVPVRDGDEILWYFTSGSEPESGPRELVLAAPPYAGPGDPFTVKVVRFSAQGNRSPAPGVDVFAANRKLGTTGANGEAQVRLTTSAALEAIGTPDDIPSNHVAVCVATTRSKCPDAHGRLIYGSGHGDRINGTRGWDRIKARAGADVVNLRSGGRDRVNCGGGRDEVIAERGSQDDRIASSCEQVLRR
jgi:hypothetical protein